MKLPIEQWIDKNGFSENVNSLFRDSIVCYKAGANRASLLFSYLAFITILKERIIAGTKPNLIKEEVWDKLISNLQDEDLWEAIVFDATQQREKIDQATKERKKDPVFNINENLRLQIKYWKDRRNDCAHFKDNTIDTFHVESFWAFVESNLAKITIEGGMQSLLNKFYNHFDQTITPPDKDITPLVREIEFSVEKPKLKVFWEALINDESWPYDLAKKKQDLISISLEVNKDFVNESLISIIKENENYLNDFLSNHPEKLLRFNFTPQEIRKFWKENLRKCDNILGIYTILLRNNLIPKSEIEESNKLVVNIIKDYSPNPIDHQILVGNEFLKAFKSEVLDNPSLTGFKSFHWVNDRADLIAGIIKNYPAEKDIILKIFEHYGSAYHSEWLLERFDDIFEQGSELTEDYKKIINTEDITIPRYLKKYFA